MKLGFVSAILPDRSLEQVLRFAASAGYACVEAMCWPLGAAERRYAGVTHIDVARLDRESAEDILRLLDMTGVSLSALGYYPNPLSPDRAEAELASGQILRLIDAAVLLGLDTVNTFIGRDWRRSVDENWPGMLAVWRPVVAYAAERGIRIGLENCPMLFSADEWPGGKNLATSPAIWRRLFADIPSEYLGLNLDPSHLVWLGIDCGAVIREFGPRIYHVHAKDARLDRERLAQVGILAHPLEYHTPKLPGLGDVNWGAFFGALTDAGYDGPVCVEVEDRAYEGSLASREAALRQSRRFLEQFVSDAGR